MYVKYKLFKTEEKRLSTIKILCKFVLSFCTVSFQAHAHTKAGSEYMTCQSKPTF